MKNTIILAAAAVLLTACAAAGVRVSDDQLATLKVGETTEGAAVSALGAPVTRARLADGTVMLVYSYVETKVRPATLIPIVGAFAGGADSRVSTATLIFDANGKLKSTSSSATQVGSGTGFSAGQVSTEKVDQPRQ